MNMQELMLRRLANHHLCAPTDAKTVLHESCGLQCQFLSNALHALRIRCGDFDGFERDVLIKSWTLRGTLHLFHRDDLPLLLHNGRTHFLRPKDTLCADERVSSPRKQHFADIITSQIRQGIETREALKSVCATSGMTEAEAESLFDPWGGILRALCENGTLCHQAQEKKAYCLCPPFTPMDATSAKLELARRYFTHYGPATVKDAAYFFGATQREIRALLTELPVETDMCEGKTYYTLPHPSEDAPLPECIYLAGFDPLLMGYEKTENPFLPPEHLRKIFTLSGIVLPSVLLHGRIVGKWKRSGKKLLVSLFEPVPDLSPIQQTAETLWPDIQVCIDN